jgi:hypothetical protein
MSRRLVPAFFLLVSLPMVADCLAAEKAPSAKAGKLAVSQDFAKAVEPGWRVGKGDWKIVDGAWQGAEIPADMHGAVARYNLEFTDAVIEFDFRLDGAKSISLTINDKKEHVCRLSIRPTGFIVTKDDHDHAGPDERVVLADEKTELKPGAWYHARVEIVGPRMTAQVGDASKPVKPIGGEHELISVKKANLGFTVAGQTASFRNLRVNLPQ